MALRVSSTVVQVNVRQIVFSELVLSGLERNFERFEQEFGKYQGEELDLLVVIKQLKQGAGYDSAFWPHLLAQLVKAAPEGKRMACVVLSDGPRRIAAARLVKMTEAIRLFTSVDDALGHRGTWIAKKKSSSPDRRRECPNCGHRF